MDKSLIEASHVFPGHYLFKVIGRADIEAPVISTVANVAGENWGGHTIRSTSSGKSIAMTLNVNAESADQVLAIYDALAKVDGIVSVF